MPPEPDNEETEEKDAANGEVIDEGRAAQDWRDCHAPSLADFAALAEQSFAALPGDVRALCGAVVFRVEDWADEDTLASVGVEHPLDLMGLFQGHGFAGVSDPATGQEPNAVTLYRRAILDYWIEHEDTLDAIVAHVLVHEIGHHFGLSDADMELIEARV